MFRVKILLYDQEDRYLSIESRIPNKLREIGVLAEYAEKSQKDFNLDPTKIKAYVSGISADAWISIAGSGKINTALTQLNIPVFTLYGYFQKATAGIGPSHLSALKKGIEQIITYGHKRIVIYTRKECRPPTPAHPEQLFINTLRSHSIAVGEDNFPLWEESLRGFRESLNNQLKNTPPTAYIFQENLLYIAAQQFFNDRGLSIPDDVSLFCMDHNPIFEWSDPPVTHSRWDQKKVLRRIVEWAVNVSSGKEDTANDVLETEYIEGGTIGPAPTKSRVSA